MKINSFSVYLAYTVPIYIPGILYVFIYSDRFLDYYTSFHTLKLITIIYILYITTLAFITSTIKYKIILPQLFFKATLVTLIFSSIAFFLLSIQLSQSIDYSLRHQGRISELGGIAIIYLFSKSAIEMFILYLVLTANSNKEVSTLEKIALTSAILCYTIGSVFLLINSFQSIYVILSLYLIFQFRKLAKQNPSNHNTLNFSQLIYPIIILPAVFLAGLYIKIGNDILDYDLSKFKESIIYLTPRFSTSLASLQTSLDNLYHRFPLEFIYTNLTTFVDRLQYITGFQSSTFNEVTNINRYNYELTFIEQGERGGASPGLLATAVLLEPILLGPALILFLISITSNLILNIKKTISTFPELIALILITLKLFESPVQIILIFDITFLSFVIFILLFSQRFKPNNDSIHSNS